MAFAEMPFHSMPLLSIPYDLQLPIVQKLNFQEFCRLSRSSTSTFDLCSSRPFRLQFKVEEIEISKDTITVRIDGELKSVDWHTVKDSAARLIAENLTLKLSMDEDRCEEITKDFRKLKVSAKKITILERPQCSPDALGELFETLGATHLVTKVNLGPAFFEHDVFMNLESLALRCCCCDCLINFKVQRATVSIKRPTVQLAVLKHQEEVFTSSGGHPTLY